MFPTKLKNFIFLGRSGMGEWFKNRWTQDKIRDTDIWKKGRGVQNEKGF